MIGESLEGHGAIVAQIVQYWTTRESLDGTGVTETPAGAAVITRFQPGRMSAELLEGMSMEHVHEQKAVVGVVWIRKRRQRL